MSLLGVKPYLDYKLLIDEALGFTMAYLLSTHLCICFEWHENLRWSRGEWYEDGASKGRQAGKTLIKDKGETNQIRGNSEA